ncbi:DUF4350 domain-containing protein [Psychroflexus tropicus]|uniref:DUF4350 domain-containing protein n=1 Tax=Psychroflexus tropicus TaxID=197345 RepID=UPI0003724B64|nr:DUF4350 domain-containing protein [Psychroflexus tropicus]
MDKKTKSFLWGTLVLIILVIIMDATAEKPIDWSPSYLHTEDKALATEIFHEGLESMASDLKHLSRPPFEVLQDSLSNGTYFFINQYVGLTDEESEKLLDWVAKGNTGFISSAGISKLLLDTLGLDVSYYVSNTQIEYKPRFNLTDETLRLNDYKISRQPFEYLYFSEIDSASTKSLGLVKSGDQSSDVQTNFVKVKWGEGSFLLHLAPQVYTNYFMVEGNNSNYTSRTLGYIDLDRPFFWDDYYKSGKKEITNPLYYLLSNTYLRSAYYLIIVASLLFVIFGGKRRQRSIPILKPIQNRSYEFTQTIAGMYLDKKDHKAIAQKQINSFLEQLRSTYQLQTHTIDTQFLKDLAFKTGKDPDDLKKLFQYIERLNTAETINQDDLKQLDQKLTTFNR